MDSGDDEMTVRMEDTDKGRIVRVAGPIDLAHAGMLRQALVETIGTVATGPSTVIDLSGATAVDLSGLQLCCSAHRTFLTRGDSLTLREVPAWFRQSAQAAGFQMRTLTCRYRRSEECLWHD